MQLRQYLEDNRITAHDFAGSIGVSVQSVHRYLSGDRFPTPEKLEVIDRATGGKVTANDFTAHHSAKRAEAEARAGASA